MKTLLALAIALPASVASVVAADLPIYIPPPNMPEPVFADWNGFHAGVIGGVGDSRHHFDHDGDEFFLCGVLCDGVVDLDLSGGGAFFGAQVGGDVQFDNWVVGVMADISKTSISAHVGADDDEITTDLDWLGTVRGRVGYAMDDLLFYLHGGAAFGKTEQYYSAGGDSDSFFDDENDIKLGYVAGVGLEYQLTQNLSFKTEYGYYDLGRDELGSDTGAYEELEFHTISAGMSFRF